MLLLLDNYDSFTYNLYQYLSELGADVQVHRNDQITLDEIEALHPDHIVVSPGPCTPNEAGLSMQVIETFGPHIPVLGVCLGHQAIDRSMEGVSFAHQSRCMAKHHQCIILSKASFAACHIHLKPTAIIVLSLNVQRFPMC